MRAGVCHISVESSLAFVAAPIKDSIRVKLAGEAQGTSQDHIYFNLVGIPYKLPLEQYRKTGGQIDEYSEEATHNRHGLAAPAWGLDGKQN